MIGSVPDLAVIVILGFVLFGAKNIPELGKGLGQGIREFKKGVGDIRSDIEGSLQEAEVVTQPPSSSTDVEPDSVEPASAAAAIRQARLENARGHETFEQHPSANSRA